ncbi:MAG: hypothetical protein ACP5O8_02290 [Candidatus Aenigmatarchaeota archaeon]
MKVFADLNETLINSNYGNLDVAIVRELDKEFPGIFRSAMEKLSEIASWESRVLEAFKVLGAYKVPREKYLSVAQNLVEKVEVPEPVVKSFEKASDVLSGVYTFTGSSQEVAEIIAEKKLKPLIPSYTELMVFGTILYHDENGLYSGKIGKLYGYNERKEMVKKLKVGDVAVGIADNYTTVNQGMVREGNYGIFLSKKWNSIDRQGNIFYVRPKHLHIAIDQILNESLPVCKWIIKRDLYEREISPRTE